MSAVFESRCGECGWTPRNPAKTAGIAEYTLRRHSCDKHRRDVAMAARVAARRAASGPVRACEHKRARHEHGTRSAYVLDRCRCRPCKDAAAASERRRTKEIAYGRWEPYVDAGPAREHVRNLMSQGMGWKRICATTGVPHGTMTKLLYGDTTRGQAPSKRVRPTTATALLAVELDLAGGAIIDAGPTWDLIHGLVAHGYSMSWISRRLGSASPLQIGDVRCEKATADAVHELAEKYATRPGPSSWARAFAHKRGWTADLLWQGLDSADGTAAPVVDEIAVERACHGDRVALTADESRVVVERLHNQGVPDGKIGARLGVSAALVGRWRKGERRWTPTGPANPLDSA